MGLRVRPSPLLRVNVLFSAFAMAMAACAPAPSPLEATIVAATPTNTPPATPNPTPTVPQTPPTLPGIYQSTRLNPLDTPRSYIEDNCEYLRNKWDSQNASPGTIVMTIMLHSINQGKAEGPDDINVSDFDRMVADLHRQKFQAVNVQQLADFLERNGKIPPRSVVLIQDGRHYAQNFDDHFREYWDKWGWPMVNAWDNRGNTSESLWADQAKMEQEGWVDHQVYGVAINPSAQPLTEGPLTEQLQQPLGDFEKYFHKKPIAIVWPNGFDKKATQIARDVGYRLGFTINSRGPLMYNWVPLADEQDSFRPSYQPEGAIGDPLMTLPRYWPSQVHAAIDSVRLLGKEAADHAEQNRDSEMHYYDIMCQPAYGPIP